MTHFFAFDEITWPEVGALRRDTPLVLPFGSGYPKDKIAEAFSDPPQIGLLPPLPYGWRGSGIHIPEKRIARLVRNLLDSLRDDGFSRVYALAPPGVFQPNDVTYQGRLLSLGPAPVDPLALPGPGEGGQKPVILIPIGHTEQHGHHLPLSTDNLIIDAIARGTAASIPDQAYALPVFPYGVSTHRASFAGTFNAGGRTFEKFWLAAIDHLVGRGFDRIYLISGHGGNCSFLVNVVKYAGERHPRIFAATTWLHTSDEIGVKALRENRRSGIGGMGHAGELETAMVLHLRPDLVHMERCIDETDFIASPSYYMDWVEGGALAANPPWDDDTATGSYGAGSLATAENGKTWLDAAIAEKAWHVEQINDQQQRRQERRNAGFGNWGKLIG